MTINNEESINKFNSNFQISEDKKTISDLPPELIENILFNLSNEELMSARGTSRDWDETSVHIISKRELAPIEEFAKLISEHLKDGPHKKQGEELLALIKEKKSLNQKSPPEIRASAQELKEKSLLILKTLSKEELADLKLFLKDEPKPKHFENLIELADVYRLYDIAKKNPENLKLEKIEFEDIPLKLFELGELKKAFEIIKNEISSPLIKKILYKEIGRKLPSEQLEKLIAVIKTDKNEILKDKNEALSNIAIGSASKGRTKQALSPLETMTERQEETKHAILEELAAKGRIKKALEIINQEPDKSKIEALRTLIFQITNKNDNYKKAIEIVLQFIPGAEKNPDMAKELILLLRDFGMKLRFGGLDDEGKIILYKGMYLAQKINEAEAAENLEKNALMPIKPNTKARLGKRR